MEFILFIMICVAAYFLPTLVAHGRHSCDFTGIFLVNLFLGWTFIGWIAALIWALSSRERVPIVIAERTVVSAPVCACSRCGARFAGGNFCNYCGGRLVAA